MIIVMHKQISKICKFCKKPFRTYPSVLKNRKFCSQLCYSRSNRKRIKCYCKQCKKIFYKWPSRIKKYKRPFCSRKCFFIFYRRDNHPAWRGGIKFHCGYIMLKKPNHPNARNSGYILKHRLIMSNHIGRLLNKNEVVHHKNRNIIDNRIKNLCLMKRGSHTTLHNTLKF